MTEILPERVTIGAIEYDVVEVHDLHDVKLGFVKQGLMGDINYEQSVIRIEAMLSDDMKDAVLWHEVLHGMIEQSGIEFDEEENVVNALGYAIPLFIKANKAYIRGMIDGEDSDG